MNFLIFGPPGSGKGTYASRLGPQLGVAHISTGDIFRQMAKGGSPRSRSGEAGTLLADEVKSYLDRGALVPDEVTVNIVKEVLKKPEAQKGFFLDGFPRTVDQARELDKIVKLDAILLLIMPEEILMEKALARRICRNCGDIYNIADISRTIQGVDYVLPPMSPKVEGKCDKCGGEIYQRADDNEKVIRDRLATYQNQSQPVLEYYKDKGAKFIEIHVSRPPEVMVGKILDLLKGEGLVG